METEATILNLARNSKHWTIAARGSLGVLCGSACPIVLDFNPPEIQPTDQLDFVEKVVANYLELLTGDYGSDHLVILLGDCDPLLFHVLLKLFTNDVRWAKFKIFQPVFHGSDWTWRVLKEKK